MDLSIPSDTGGYGRRMETEVVVGPGVPPPAGIGGRQVGWDGERETTRGAMGGVGGVEVYTN